MSFDQLLEEASKGERVVFARCPSSREMLEYVERNLGLGAFRRLEIRLHLLHCPLCRQEAAWASRTIVEPSPREAAGRFPFAGWFSGGWVWAAAAAALVLFVLVYPFQFGTHRFARYARLPDLPYETMLAEFQAAHPEDLPRFRAAVRLIRLGEYDSGQRVITELESQYPGDPSLVFFRGYVAARQENWEYAVAYCTRAESRNLNGFRCWYLANLALKAGDLSLARREIGHAMSHPEYRQLASRLERLVH